MCGRTGCEDRGHIAADIGDGGQADGSVRRESGADGVGAIAGLVTEIVSRETSGRNEVA